MTDEKRPVVREGQEMWELTTPGRVWIEVLVDEKTGKTKMITANGKGSRFTLKTDDRKFVQDRCRKPKDDVFTNGMLIRVDADQQDDEETASPNAITDEDLKKIFEYKQVARFQNTVKDLSEVTIRRMKDMMKREEVEATGAQERFINEYLAENFAVNQNPLDPDKRMPVHEMAATQVVRGREG